MAPRITPAPDKFHSSWIGEPNSGCWLWVGSVRSKGYGVLQARKGVQQAAHRFSWELHNGPIPAGMLVCHKCDTPACVNPLHLFLGTIADNNRDMLAKGRYRPNTRLTPLDIREILRSPLSPNELAKVYEMSACAIRHIRNRRSWTHPAYRAFVEAA